MLPGYSGFVYSYIAVYELIPSGLRLETSPGVFFLSLAVHPVGMPSIWMSSVSVSWWSSANDVLMLAAPEE